MGVGAVRVAMTGEEVVGVAVEAVGGGSGEATAEEVAGSACEGPLAACERRSSCSSEKARAASLKMCGGSACDGTGRGERMRGDGGAAGARLG